MRLTTDLFAYCAERIPSWNTISISGYHIREAGSTAVQELAFTLANGIAYCEAAVAAGLDAGRVRRAAVVLLQRPQRLLPGGGEVPGGAAAVGAGHGRAVRRDEPAGARAPVPRADRRLDADRAAARAEHRPGRDPGALGGAAAAPVAAHELVRRGARAALGARGDDRAAHAAGARERGRRRLDRRPARRLVLRRGAHRRARGARARADRARSTSSAARSRRSRPAGCRARSRRAAYEWTSDGRGRQRARSSA